MAEVDGDMEVLAKLTQAIEEAYRADPTGPSVTLGWSKGSYYASVVRYSKPFGHGKRVVCHARSEDVGQAARRLAIKWVDLTNGGRFEFFEETEVDRSCDGKAGG